MFKFGNKKLGDDTVIFNLGTAKNCPSKKLGMCNAIKCGARCYALKAEIQYPRTVPNYRVHQLEYWDATGDDEILEDISSRIKRRRKPTRYFRFNESGDFRTQQDVNRLSKITEGLKGEGLTVYGYTARRDLDFRNVEFLVKGSGHSGGNNGRTTIIGKKEAVPKGYIE